jgi:hypothetical protein
MGSTGPACQPNVCPLREQRGGYGVSGTWTKGPKTNAAFWPSSQSKFCAMPGFLLKSRITWAIGNGYASVFVKPAPAHCRIMKSSNSALRSIPRADTRERAKALLKRFGSLA